MKLSLDINKDFEVTTLADLSKLKISSHLIYELL